MARKRIDGRGLLLAALIFFSASSIISCAGRDTQDTTEPVVSDEASIPDQATEPEPEDKFSPALIKKSETEVIVVRDLKAEQPVIKDTPPQPKSVPVNTAPGSIDDSWFLVADIVGNKVYKVYVDTQSIENAADGVQSWSKLEFESTQRDEDGLSYSEVHIESSIDCEERTYAYNTSKFYNQIGQLVYQEDIEYNRTDITPETLSAFVADFVCGYDYEAE